MVLARMVPCTILSLCVSSAFALPGVTQRVNVSSTGAEGVTHSLHPNCESSKISADGRFVVFTSYAGSLVPNDTNGTRDVFVRNRVTNTTELVSLNGNGEQAIYGGYASDISADGRYVLFESADPGLVPGDTNDETDLFVRDRLLGTTERVNVSSDGEQAEGSHLSTSAISADGRYVVFSSAAANLVPDDTNGRYDTFVRDRIAGTTERVSVSTIGEEANSSSYWASMSADGRYASFYTRASNLVLEAYGGIYVRDRAAAATEYVDGSSLSRDPMIGPDGRCVVWQDEERVFLYDRLQGTTEEVTVNSNGEPGIHQGGSSDWSAGAGGLSSDGRYVCFHTCLVGLAPGDSDGRANVYLRDRVAGTTELVSVNPSGFRVAGSHSSISADGRCIAFLSDSTLVVPGDTNGQVDAFVRDLDARFHDVASCFWAFDEIEACVGAQMAYGYPDNTYRPEYAVTRDQMAVYVARGVAGGEENVPEFAGMPTFPDVDAAHWALDYVEYTVDQNVVAGYEDGLYHPEYEVARDQMAVYVARALVAPSGEAALADYVPAAPRNFPDVPSDFWAYTHIEYCVEKGVVQGYADALYHPEYAVTRDQMAVYIARAFELGT